MAKLITVCYLENCVTKYVSIKGTLYDAIAYAQEHELVVEQYAYGAIQ